MAKEKGGRKYRLLIYEEILNRWWPLTLGLAIMLFFYVGALWGAEWYFIDPSKNPLPRLSSLGGYVVIGMGILALALSFFLLIVRRRAYVQLFDSYVMLATPFLRVNISYKRIHRTVAAQVASLFPPRSYRGWKREIIEPLSGETALVVHLTAYPLSRSSLNLFLSSFFFYDNTPHFVLIVDDWMRLSVELDSRRMGVKTSRQPPKPKLSSGLLDDLNRR